MLSKIIWEYVWIYGIILYDGIAKILNVVFKNFIKIQK